MAGVVRTVTRIPGQIVRGAENALVSVGLGDPTARMVVGGAIGLGIGYLIKPDLYFEKTTGVIRPWKVTSAEKHATWLPWWTSGVAGAVVFGMLM